MRDYKEFYSNHKDTKVKDDSVRRMSFRNALKKSDQFKELFFPIISNNKLYKL